MSACAIFQSEGGKSIQRKERRSPGGREHLGVDGEDVVYDARDFW
jgi:hypothetical protein